MDMLKDAATVLLDIRCDTPEDDIALCPFPAIPEVIGVEVAVHIWMLEQVESVKLGMLGSWPLSSM
jgi:hypothetical protein